MNQSSITDEKFFLLLQDNHQRSLEDPNVMILLRVSLFRHTHDPLPPPFRILPLSDILIFTAEFFGNYRRVTLLCLFRRRLARERQFSRQISFFWRHWRGARNHERPMFDCWTTKRRVLTRSTGAAPPSDWLSTLRCSSGDAPRRVVARAYLPAPVCPPRFSLLYVSLCVRVRVCRVCVFSP